ncbi:protein of unknown function [Maridesulfovibrio hydrothermalis AM13 = DSM 14728]|uniref:Uncharacterized protein n=1 Tax=Maridesulfovibrio hydrothermalis AM13 = DSM 14728 TaxID=1121451 RepID=L0RBB7_9BACT|nr:protein of unknown function [Maridesulfovibrio hydrothermalis AM13 = DSM 14728]
MQISLQYFTLAGKQLTTSKNPLILKIRLLIYSLTLQRNCHEYKGLHVRIYCCGYVGPYRSNF